MKKISLILTAKHLSFIGMILQIAVNALGMPMQAYAIVSEKASDQVSLNFFFLVLFASIAWFLHAIKAKNRHLAISTGVGTSFTFMIIVLTYWYR